MVWQDKKLTAGLGLHMRDFSIRIWAQGNPGNIIMMYLTALKLRKTLGFGTLRHVHIPLFNINLPDHDLHGMIGLHDRNATNGRLQGAFPFEGYKNAIHQCDASFLTLDGFYQHISNFPDRSSFDYDREFPALTDTDDHGGEDDLVINIRGGDILKAIHPHYTQLPPEFYEALIARTGKHPIFYGQLDPSPYLEELKQRFPTATFIPSRGVERDFDFIRKSHYIVPALSTFSWLAAWLSNAKKIFFPVAGIFSPAQHPSAMLLPLDDKRYEFYTFPIYFARNIADYREYMDPIRNLWQYSETEMLRDICKPKERSLDAGLNLFNAEEYLALYPEFGQLYKSFGNSGLVNHFCEAGFWESRKPFFFDETFYSSRYPMAALAVSQGHYRDMLDHYLLAGHKMGYRPHP